MVERGPGQPPDSSPTGFPLPASPAVLGGEQASSPAGGERQEGAAAGTWSG